MAESVYQRLAIRDSTAALRHSALVRITHWATACCFLALLISGIAILLAHPRFYWGETGGVGTPSLFDLPLPFVLTGQSGWGRSLHFLSAWVLVSSGVLYVFYGLVTGYFRRNLLPLRADLTRDAISHVLGNHLRLRFAGEADSHSYNVLQRLAYLSVVFVLFPLIIGTGLAMSPAVTSAAPVVVNVFGGQQSARTIHFLLSTLIVAFVIVHVTMVIVAGFTKRVGPMITGHGVAGTERL
jgi:thiosulfate reductase cytochrome b subunit